MALYFYVGHQGIAPPNNGLEPLTISTIRTSYQNFAQNSISSFRSCAKTTAPWDECQNVIKSLTKPAPVQVGHAVAPLMSEWYVDDISRLEKNSTLCRYLIVLANIVLAELNGIKIEVQYIRLGEDSSSPYAEQNAKPDMLTVAPARRFLNDDLNVWASVIDPDMKAKVRASDEDTEPRMLCRILLDEVQVAYFSSANDSPVFYPHTTISWTTDLKNKVLGFDANGKPSITLFKNKITHPDNRAKLDFLYQYICAQINGASLKKGFDLLRDLLDDWMSNSGIIHSNVRVEEKVYPIKPFHAGHKIDIYDIPATDQMVPFLPTAGEGTSHSLAVALAETFHTQLPEGYLYKDINGNSMVAIRPLIGSFSYKAADNNPITSNGVPAVPGQPVSITVLMNDPATQTPYPITTYSIPIHNEIKLDVSEMPVGFRLPTTTAANSTAFYSATTKYKFYIDGHSVFNPVTSVPADATTQALTVYDASSNIPLGTVTAPIKSMGANGSITGACTPVNIYKLGGGVNPDVLRAVSPEGMTLVYDQPISYDVAAAKRSTSPSTLTHGATTDIAVKNSHGQYIDVIRCKVSVYATPYAPCPEYGALLTDDTMIPAFLPKIFNMLSGEPRENRYIAPIREEFLDYLYTCNTKYQLTRNPGDCSITIGKPSYNNGTIAVSVSVDNIQLTKVYSEEDILQDENIDSVLHLFPNRVYLYQNPTDGNSYSIWQKYTIFATGSEALKMHDPASAVSKFTDYFEVYTDIPGAVSITFTDRKIVKGESCSESQYGELDHPTKYLKFKYKETLTAVPTYVGCLSPDWSTAKSLIEGRDAVAAMDMGCRNSIVAQRISGINGTQFVYRSPNLLLQFASFDKGNNSAESNSLMTELQMLGDGTLTDKYTSAVYLKHGITSSNVFVDGNTVDINNEAIYQSASMSTDFKADGKRELLKTLHNAIPVALSPDLHILMSQALLFSLICAFDNNASQLTWKYSAPNRGSLSYLQQRWSAIVNAINQCVSNVLGAAVSLTPNGILEGEALFSYIISQRGMQVWQRTLIVDGGDGTFDSLLLDYDQQQQGYRTVSQFSLDFAGNNILLQSALDIINAYYVAEQPEDVSESDFVAQLIKRRDLAQRNQELRVEPDIAALLRISGDAGADTNIQETDDSIVHRIYKLIEFEGRGFKKAQEIKNLLTITDDSRVVAFYRMIVFKYVMLLHAIYAYYCPQLELSGSGLQFYGGTNELLHSVFDNPKSDIVKLMNTWYQQWMESKQKIDDTVGDDGTTISLQREEPVLGCTIVDNKLKRCLVQGLIDSGNVILNAPEMETDGEQTHFSYDEYCNWIRQTFPIDMFSYLYQNNECVFLSRISENAYNNQVKAANNDNNLRDMFGNYPPACRKTLEAIYITLQPDFFPYPEIEGSKSHLR